MDVGYDDARLRGELRRACPPVLNVADSLGGLLARIGTQAALRASVLPCDVPSMEGRGSRRAVDRSAGALCRGLRRLVRPVAGAVAPAVQPQPVQQALQFGEAAAH